MQQRCATGRETDIVRRIENGSVEPLPYSIPSDDYASRAGKGREKKVPAITTTLKKLGRGLHAAVEITIVAEHMVAATHLAHGRNVG